MSVEGAELVKEAIKEAFLESLKKVCFALNSNNMKVAYEELKNGMANVMCNLKEKNVSVVKLVNVLKPNLSKIGLTEEKRKKLGLLDVVFMKFIKECEKKEIPPQVISTDSLPELTDQDIANILTMDSERLENMTRGNFSDMFKQTGFGI